jgi:hypothetical protein
MKANRRISKNRVNAYLRRASAKLTQEEKLEAKIAKATKELEKRQNNGVSSLAIRLQENLIRKLNSELLSVRNRRLEAERLFENAVLHNDKLNGGEESSSLVIA